MSYFFYLSIARLRVLALTKSSKVEGAKKTLPSLGRLKTRFMWFFWMRFLGAWINLNYAHYFFFWEIGSDQKTFLPPYMCRIVRGFILTSTHWPALHDENSSDYQPTLLLRIFHPLTLHRYIGRVGKRKSES